MVELPEYALDAVGDLAAEAPVRAFVSAPRGHRAHDFVVALIEAGPGAADDVVRLRGRRLEATAPWAALGPVISAADADPATARAALMDRAGREGLVVVEDAQWLDEETVRTLAAVAERAEEHEVGLVVVSWPLAGDEAMRALRAALTRVGREVRFDPLDEEATGTHLAAVLDAAVTPELTDAAREWSGGVPEYVERLAEGWRDDGVIDGGRLVAENPAPSADVLDELAAALDALEPAAARLLNVLTVAPEADDELLVELAQLDGVELASVMGELRNEAMILVGHDEPIAVVGAAAVAAMADEERRAVHARAAATLAERGAPVTVVADHLVAAGASGSDTVAALLTAAGAVAQEAAAQAAAWLDRAEELGADAERTAVLRSEVLFAEGRLDDALGAADLAMAVAPEAEAARGQVVAAAVLADRGLWRLAADRLLSVGDHPTLSAAEVAITAVPGLIGAGQVDIARRLVGEVREDDGPAPGLAAMAGLLTAEAALDALDGGEGLDVSRFAEAGDLVEGRAPSPVLMTPHEMGTILASAVGEFTGAQDLVARARATGSGGPALVDRWMLWSGWIAQRAGRWADAEAALADLDHDALITRDEIFAAALAAALARKSGDIARLTEAWNRAEPLMLRQPVNLYSLEAATELLITARRLGSSVRIRERTDELVSLVAAADVPLATVTLRWGQLQAAIAAEAIDEVPDRAAAVAAVEGVPLRLAGLAPAASAWVGVLAGDVDDAVVDTAADGLVEAGQIWEASRLIGQAAIRATDPGQARRLLERARDLKALLPGEEDGAVGAVTASVLSDREEEVARFVAQGLTYKEIGAELFISPKTVEHHVAKIRQKLGASTRAEMLAALREQLS